MTEGVRPVGPVTRRDRRDAERRLSERRLDAAQSAAHAADAREIALIEVVEEPLPSSSPARPASPPAPGAAFAAQLMGQGGQRRGIRGGPPILDAARNTYLGNEYSGGNDRRPPSGKATRTDV